MPTTGGQIPQRLADVDHPAQVRLRDGHARLDQTVADEPRLKRASVREHLATTGVQVVVRLQERLDESQLARRRNAAAGLPLTTHPQ
jgi:hypothetical protein